MKKIITLRETIEEFAEKKSPIMYTNKKIETFEIEKILFKIGEFKNKTEEEKNNEIKKIKEKCMYKISPENIMCHLEDIVTSARTGKEKKHFVCNKYIEFINREKYFNIKLKRLSPLYTNLERQIELCKKMHSNFDLDKISEEFRIGSRTLDEDLRKLRDGEISVMGQTLQVKYDTRRNGNIKMTSTAHPLFLVQNLTQIIAMLNGLLYVCESSREYREYAENTAIDIWMQLSDYAQNRILNELIEHLGLDGGWYNYIAKEASERKNLLLDDNQKYGHFRDEKEVSKDAYLWILKNQQPCSIEYVDEEGNNKSLNASRISCKANNIVCVTSDGEVEIPLKNINNFIPYSGRNK